VAEWITFEDLAPKAGQKTALCIVRSKQTNETLGIIKWFNAWRRYAFDPVPNTIYSKECLIDISVQINKMAKERGEKDVIKKGA
jgi:hypothetical protein